MAVGDTVGEPVQYTAGPPLHILIAVMSLVATVSGAIIARVSPFGL